VSLNQERAESGGSVPPQADVLNLFDELGNPLTRYLLAMRIPLERAQDLVQDAFVELAEHIAAERPSHNLRGWLFRVVHNFGLKERRREQSARSRLTSLVDTDTGSEAVSDPSASPEARLLLNERQRRLITALATLPENERQAIQLRAEGLRYREIAKVVGLSTSGVGEALRRAVETLRKAAHE
jgi:RNA polymerase sigma-70 factor (ECF subfamily)